MLAPIPRPPNVIAIGRNYLDYASEEGLQPPQEPAIFLKFANSVVGPCAKIRWDPDYTTQVDFEAELAIVVGRKARDVPVERALDYVLGYTCLNDVSARDLQFNDVQWAWGKSLDSFCPLGPAIVTTDEIRDPQNLQIRCIVNGSAMQSANTADMFYSVVELVSYCSRAFTLRPGDVIATGTPGGVGIFRDPPKLLSDGDEVVVEIDGIGSLTNICRTTGGG